MTTSPYDHLELNRSNDYHRLAWIHYQSQQLDKAIADCREAVRLNPYNHLSHRLLGLCFADLGRWDDAIAAYQSACAIYPSYDTAHFHLGVALHEKKQWDKADAAFKKTLRLQSKNGAYYSSAAQRSFFYLAMTHWQLGDKTQAHNWYDKGIAWMEKYSPNNASLRDGVRAQAAELLGIEEPKPKDKQLPPPKE
jgi:tetratricopeptide (TPR) repeat protein